MNNKKDHDAQKLLFIANLIASELDKTAMQAWRPGWCHDRIPWTAARDANVIIHKMIRVGYEES